ncbi:MAG: GumC family protein [Acidobacteriota bacterium]
MDYKEKRREVDLMDYWRVVVKRRWVVIFFAGTLILFTGVFSFLATPKYESSSTLLIEEGTSKILSMEEAFAYQSPVIRDMTFFNTQLELLKSKSLAERVVEKLKLLSRPEFDPDREKSKNIAASIKDILTLKWLSFKKKSKDEKTGSMYPRDPYSDVAEQIRNGLEVSPIRDTKLVKVSYTSTSPVLSAEIVNALSEEFINFSVEKRYERTQQASDFLNTQIAVLQEELAEKTQELQRYVKDKDLFSLSSLSDTESSVISTLADYNEAYTQARIERIKAEATYRELKDVDNVDSIPQAVSNPVIQQLKAEYSRIKNEYEEKSKKFKPNYPEMVQLKARMDSMKEELRNQVETAEEEYRAALRKERYLKNLLNGQKEGVSKMSSDAILYNSLKIEVENKRKQLDSLVERRDETQISEQLGGLESSNISIIDKGEVPEGPVSPKKKLNLILAFFMGIFGGVGLCFIFEYLDNKVRDPEEVERLAGLPSLGIIPYLDTDGMRKGKGNLKYYGYRYSYGEGPSQSGEEVPEVKEIELINHLFPRLSVSEDYRTIRTSIMLSHAEEHPRTIAFSSALPMEGKTATVVNMAVSFAQLDEKVLVVDSDLRRPKLHRIFKLRNVHGLSSYLTGKAELKDAIHKTSIDNIWILPSGPVPPNPTELLNSKKMKKMIEEAEKEFDFILLDTPPALAVTDGLIVSSFSESTVLVINGGKLTRKMFMKAVGELKRAKANIIGVVFNGIKVSKGEYFYMDHYRSYYRDEEKKHQGIEK